MNIFVSQPMSGLSNEEVNENRENAMMHLCEYYDSEAIIYDSANVFTEEDKYEENRLIQSHEENSEKFVSLFYFLRSIQHMVDCDKIVFIDKWYESRGCCLEYLIARMFDIPRILMIRDKDTNEITFKDDDDDLLTIPLALKLILTKIHHDKNYKY